MSNTCSTALFGEILVIKANRKKERVRDKTGFIVCLMIINIVSVFWCFDLLSILNIYIVVKNKQEFWVR